MIDGQKSFEQPVRNNLKSYGSIRKIATDQGKDYTTGCLLGYNYFKNYYKMIAIDLSKQQSFDADPKTIQQIKFTASSKGKWGGQDKTTKREIRNCII